MQPFLGMNYFQDCSPTSIEGTSHHYRYFIPLVYMNNIHIFTAKTYHVLYASSNLRYSLPEKRIFMERTPERILPQSLKSTSASSGSAVIYSTYIHIHIPHLGHPLTAIQKPHWVNLYPELLLGLSLKKKKLIKHVRKKLEYKAGTNPNGGCVNGCQKKMFRRDNKNKIYQELKKERKLWRVITTRFLKENVALKIAAIFFIILLRKKKTHLMKRFLGDTKPKIVKRKHFENSIKRKWKQLYDSAKPDSFSCKVSALIFIFIVIFHMSLRLYAISRTYLLSNIAVLCRFYY